MDSDNVTETLEKIISEIDLEKRENEGNKTNNAA